MSDLYPVDIESVIKYGIQDWEKSYFYPVSEDEFVDLSNNIKEIVFKHTNYSSDQEIRDILTINIKIFVEIVNLIHKKMVLDRLRQLGKKAVYRETSIIYKGICEKGVPFGSHYDYYEDKKYFVGGIKKRLRNKLSTLKHTFLLNSKSIRNSLKAFNSNIITLSTQDNIKEFLAENNSFVKYKRFDSFFLSNDIKPLSYDIIKLINDCADSIANDIFSYCEKRDILIHHPLRCYLYELIVSRLSYTASLYFQVKKSVARLKEGTILAAGLGNIFHRVICLTAMRENKHVIGFSHGNVVGMFDRDVNSYNEMSVVNEYRVYTKGCESNFRALVKSYPCLQDNQVEVMSQNSKKFKRLHEDYGSLKRPTKIKSVMIVGVPMINYRGQGSSFSLNQVFLEFKAIQCLKENNYQVIYKMHPYNRMHPNLFIDMDIDIIKKERFEDIIGYTDAFLFLHIGSSTFGITLLTNKPVAFLGYPYFKWFEEPYRLLKRRCRTFKGYYDEHNRLNFNGNELIEVLGRKVEEPDTGFIEKYMFPESN